MWRNGFSWSTWNPLAAFWSFWQCCAQVSTWCALVLPWSVLVLFHVFLVLLKLPSVNAWELVSTS